jgi:hypothetical protein
MRLQVAVFVSFAAFGFVSISPHALAQQKTVKECQQEWRANKAANQANGITEKAYVAQCRGGGSAPPGQTTAAPPAPAPIPSATATGQKSAKDCREEWRANKAANQASGVMEKVYVAQCRGGAAPAQSNASPPPPARPAPTATGQKTAKECRDEWRANKAANQANGITEKAYIAQCRGGITPAETNAPPPTAPAPGQTRAAPPAAPPPAPTASAPPARPAPPPAPSAAPTPTISGGANEFSTEAQAKSRCPADTVVWTNLPTKIYHFGDTRFYGETKHGAYMCERDAVAAGMRAAKNETHP